MSIQAAIESYLKVLEPYGAQLVAVTKTYPPAVLQEAYEYGLRIFGENKVQEMTEKQPVLPADIHWHQIGHLQTNKVKYIAPFVSMIESVDSLKVLQEIDKQAKKNERVISCLVQLELGREETKFGMTATEILDLLESDAFRQMQHVRIEGLMGIATYTSDMQQLRLEFRQLRQVFDSLKQQYFAHQPAFRHRSMGITSDYRIALEEGSTMVRIGSGIFGARSYQQ